VLALQLFLSVNKWLHGVSDLIRQIIYFAFIFGSGLVVVLINAYAYGDNAWGTNGMYETIHISLSLLEVSYFIPSGSFSLGTREGLLYPFLSMLCFLCSPSFNFGLMCCFSSSNSPHQYHVSTDDMVDVCRRDGNYPVPSALLL
jgi:hypothetical protein